MNNEMINLAGLLKTDRLNSVTIKVLDKDVSVLYTAIRHGDYPNTYWELLVHDFIFDDEGFESSFSNQELLFTKVKLKLYEFWYNAAYEVSNYQSVI